MNRIVLFLLLLLLIISFTASSQLKIGPDGDAIPTGNYPGFKQINLRSNVYRVRDVAARNAIPANFRDTGMMVMTTIDSTTYQLQGGILNLNWVLLWKGIPTTAIDTTTRNTGIPNYGRTILLADSIAKANASGQTLQQVTNNGSTTTNSIRIGLPIPNTNTVETDSIWFFGNSITAGSGVGANRWTAFMSAKYNAVEINKGIGGTTMQQRFAGDSSMYERRYVIPFYNTRYRFIFFSYGVNDSRQIQYDTIGYKSAYNAVINECIAKGWPMSKIIITLPTWWGQPSDLVARAPEYVTAGRNFANAKGIQWINGYDVIYADTTGYMQADKVHPNVAGHTAMADSFYNRIQRFTTIQDTSGLLTLSATNKGFIPVRMNTAQMNAITNPATGLEIYNLDSSYSMHYTGTSWVRDGLLGDFVTINTNQTITAPKIVLPQTTIPAMSNASFYGWDFGASYTYTSGAPLVFGSIFRRPTAGSLILNNVYAARFAGRTLFDSLPLFQGGVSISQNASMPSGFWNTVGVASPSYSSNSSANVLTIYQPTGNLSTSILLRSGFLRTATTSINNGFLYLDSVSLSNNLLIPGYNTFHLRSIMRKNGFTGISRGLYITNDNTGEADWRAIEPVVNAGNGWSFYGTGTAPAWFGGQIRNKPPSGSATNTVITRDATDSTFKELTMSALASAIGLSGGSYIQNGNTFATPQTGQYWVNTSSGVSNASLDVSLQARRGASVVGINAFSGGSGLSFTDWNVTASNGFNNLNFAFPSGSITPFYLTPSGDAFVYRNLYSNNKVDTAYTNAGGDSLVIEINGRRRPIKFGGSGGGIPTLQQVTTAGATSNVVTLFSNRLNVGDAANYVPNFPQFDFNVFGNANVYSSLTVGGSSGINTLSLSNGSRGTSEVYLQGADSTGTITGGHTAKNIIMNITGGAVGIGTTTVGTDKLAVSGTGSFNGTVSGSAATAGNQFIVRQQLTDSLSIFRNSTFDSTFRMTATTTNNTPTTAVSIPIQNGIIYDIQFRAIASSSGSEGGKFNSTVMVGNNGSGAAILDGGMEDIITPMLTSTFSSTSVTGGVSGNNFVITVTGVAATTVKWKFAFSILKSPQ
jgi:lysophospholipase L1-like esterase